MDHKPVYGCYVVVTWRLIGISIYFSWASNPKQLGVGQSRKDILHAHICVYACVCIVVYIQRYTQNVHTCMHILRKNVLEQGNIYVYICIYVYVYVRKCIYVYVHLFFCA